MEFQGDDMRLLEDTYRSLPTKEVHDLDFVLERGIGAVIRDSRQHIAGIALAVAGPIPDHKIMRSAANTSCLRNRVPINLVEILNAHFEGEHHGMNDVEVACAGEMERGSLRGVQNALFENIGSGWGGAEVRDGKVWVAEPGHMYVPKKEALCGCGKRGCAEAVASGTAVERNLRTMEASGTIAIPDQFRDNPGAFLDQEAKKEVPWAVDYYTDLGETVGEIWGSRLNLHPFATHITFQGSLLECAWEIDCFRNAVKRKLLERTMLPDWHRDLVIGKVSAPVLPETNEPLGPLYGAASIWKRLHDERHKVA
jgi:predicted NBD/HSP70 family sugar kinase